MNLYHKLLDLPESETPPDHYGLLGIPRFTDDAKQIHAALLTRNTQLRAWDNSKLYREANALLDEVVAAGMLLEDPIRKAVYDAELRQRLGLSEPQPPLPVSVVTPAAVVDEPVPALPPARRKKSNANQGSGLFCAKHPKGRSGKRDPTPDLRPLICDPDGEDCRHGQHDESLEQSAPQRAPLVHRLIREPSNGVGLGFPLSATASSRGRCLT